MPHAWHAGQASWTGLEAPQPAPAPACWPQTREHCAGAQGGGARHQAARPSSSLVTARAARAVTEGVLLGHGARRLCRGACVCCKAPVVRGASGPHRQGAGCSQSHSWLWGWLRTSTRMRPWSRLVQVHLSVQDIRCAVLLRALQARASHSRTGCTALWLVDMDVIALSA